MMQHINITSDNVYETYCCYFWCKMRFSMNKTIKNFEEIDCFQIEHTKNPWK